MKKGTECSVDIITSKKRCKLLYKAPSLIVYGKAETITMATSNGRDNDMVQTTTCEVNANACMS